ncbi:hypothetical protein BRC81_11495 [Halobacteriales archaeon QS_1_68_20]|nr:MAG: hypothetical protein BRC81_11495 [Halobacteriales archaeon QS_1_68_20]
MVRHGETEIRQHVSIGVTGLTVCLGREETAKETSLETGIRAGWGLPVRPGGGTVGVGETVRWVWDAGGHNVKPDDVPGESDWSGTPGQDTYGAGYEYEHVFEVAGTYRYVCLPHEDVGMTGTVHVE